MKTVLVTGGSNGIGKAISEHLLGLGHFIIIADLDESNEENQQISFKRLITYCMTTTSSSMVRISSLTEA